jgi:hypothetical protein
VSSFDAVSHNWLVRFVERRVGDRRVIRLIRKWLKAGVAEDGQVTPGTVGRPQGAVISPLLANICDAFLGLAKTCAKAWRGVLGLSGQRSGRPPPEADPTVATIRPMPRPARLIPPPVRGFAPVTLPGDNLLRE